VKIKIFGKEAKMENLGHWEVQRCPFWAKIIKLNYGKGSLRRSPLKHPKYEWRTGTIGKRGMVGGETDTLEAAVEEIERHAAASFLKMMEEIIDDYNYFEVSNIMRS